MIKMFRSFLLLLLLPVMIAAFYLESKLQLPPGGHELFLIGIVAAICWLAWRWVVFNETSNWREARKVEPARYHYRLASSLEYAETRQNEPIIQRRNGAARVVTSIRMPLPAKRVETMSFHFSPTRVAHALMSVGFVFALTVVMLLIGSKTLGEGVIAILYLLPIGWCTVRLGQIAGVSAALTAALCFDFLFIPPYHTFTIGRLEGWLLLFLFIATAILVVGRIQTILTEEHQRERKATFLFEMVAAIANQATREGIALVIANQIQQKFLAEGVQVHLLEGYGYPSFIAHADNGQASASSSKPDRALSIVSGPVLIGEIDIWQGVLPLPSADDPMLQTMLTQTTAALERVRVAEGKPPYPKQKPSYSEGNSFQASHS
jgi:hypothetical protein